MWAGALHNCTVLDPLALKWSSLQYTLKLFILATCKTLFLLHH